MAIVSPFLGAVPTGLRLHPSHQRDSMERTAVSISSMTGFARSEGRQDTLGWTWELRSVNSKGLDLRIRLPAGFDGLEADIRTAVSKRFKRGAITVGLTIAREQASDAVRVNEDLLAAILELHGRYADRVDTAPLRLDALLAVRGVVEVGETEDDETVREARAIAVKTGFEQALDRLAVARREEGAKLTEMLGALRGEIEALVRDAAASAATQPDAIRARLEAQLGELVGTNPPVAPERLAQEIALLVAKADVREEIDRLLAHLDQADQLLAAGEPVGRRLDFLCQEFNREANTLCSKSADVALTRTGLALKAAIEQFREQVQNVE